MTQTELMADVLIRGGEMLKMTLADFTEADMHVRPVPGANHAAWQLGHLIGAAHFMFGGFGAGVVPDVAGRIAEKFSGSTSSVDDPAFFPSKADLVDAFTRTQAALANWVKTLSPADLDKSTGEQLANFAPTVGHLIIMTGSHIMMHLGQMQVIRRKLGKPLLF